MSTFEGRLVYFTSLVHPKHVIATTPDIEAAKNVSTIHTHHTHYNHYNHHNHAALLFC